METILVLLYPRHRPGLEVFYGCLYFSSALLFPVFGLNPLSDSVMLICPKLQLGTFFPPSHTHAGLVYCLANGVRRGRANEETGSSNQRLATND
jgi:hypothetical protein